MRIYSERAKLFETESEREAITAIEAASRAVQIASTRVGEVKSDAVGWEHTREALRIVWAILERHG